jgi:hypothetical protein
MTTTREKRSKALAIRARGGTDTQTTNHAQYSPPSVVYIYFAISLM